MQQQFIKTARTLGMALAFPAGITLSLFSLSASAQNTTGDTAIGLRPSYASCTDHRDDEAPPAAVECTAEEYKYQDERLNKVYKHLMTSLDKARQEQLRQEERAWLEIRKGYCDTGSSANKVALLKSKDCNVYETAKRATELEYFERHMSSNH